MNRNLSASVGLIALTLSSMAYAVVDSCDAFGPLTGLSALESGDRFYTGLNKNDYLGESIATGDFDGDGEIDLLVGVSGADVGGNNTGSALVFYGPIAAGAPLLATSADLILAGTASGENAGWSVANAGDVDGDGIDDMLVGSMPATGSSVISGRAYLVLGGANAGTINLTAADAVFSGDVANSEFGSHVNGIGDINGDSFADILIGAPNRTVGAATAAGVAFIWYGPVLGANTAGTDQDVVLTQNDNQSSFGLSSAGVGDVNGDGFDDVLVGSPRADANGSQSGAAYLYYGGAGANGLAAVTPITSADARIFGVMGDRTGASVAAAGDTNGDGFADFWVGSKQWGSTKRGALYLFHGSDSLSIAMPTETFSAAQIRGQDANDLLGSSAAGNVDFDGDGILDVLIGAERADGAVVQSGASYVVHGPFSGTINLGNTAATQTRAAKFAGRQESDFAGAAVAAGDLNGDGFADAITGSKQATATARPAATRAGLISVFFGGEDTVDETTFYADADADGFGNSAVTQLACSAPNGYVTNALDCNDSSTAFRPGAPEACGGGLDNNCDGFAGDTIDHDGDGFQACQECDDRTNAIHPNADERCADGIDNDCDGLIDDATSVDALNWYPDVDADGFGPNALMVRACEDPGVFLGNVVNEGGDCADNDAARNPDAIEYCDIIDNNCDGATDEPTAADANTYFRDVDGDTYGNFAATTRGCSLPAGYVENADDCNDTTEFIAPGATEVCDFVDNDCDGMHYLGGKFTASNYVGRFRGIAAGNELGRTLAFIDDTNSDGFDDILVAAPLESSLIAQGGAVYLFHGGPAAADVDLTQPGLDALPQYVTRFRHDRAQAAFGDAMVSGDFNGDGISDVAIGAYGARTPNYQQGGVYVFYGPFTDKEYTTAQAGFIAKGEADADQAGKALAVGDIDGDGVDDLVVGAVQADPGGSNRGKAYIIYGDTGANAPNGEIRLDLADAFVNGLGPTNGGGLGNALATVDLDNDGRDEVVIGASNQSSNIGSVFIVAGSATRYTGSVTPTTTLTGKTSPPSQDGLGESLANAGDVDGDGFDDLLVGSRRNAAYLIRGGAGAVSSGNADSVAAFRFVGSLGSNTGYSVAHIGDVDGDGFADMAIGASRDGDGGTNAGAVFVVYGAPAAFYAGVDAVDGTVDQAVALTNLESFGRVAPNTTFPTFSASNRGWLEGAKLLSNAAQDQFGTAVAGGGDYNGDGYPDILVGAPNFRRDANNLRVGAAYVYAAGPYGTDDDATLATQTEYHWDSDADLHADENDTRFTTCEMHAPISFRNVNAPVRRGIPVASAPTLDDCDDTNHQIHPGATESNSDAIDSDCDGFNNRNTLPRISLRLEPNPTYGHTTVTQTAAPTDADGDVVAVTYAWYVNDVLVAGITGNSLDANYFEKNQTIRLVATLDDGRGVLVTEELTRSVGNSLPTLTLCSLAPTTVYMNTDLNASSQGLNDSDMSDTPTLSVSYHWETRRGGSWRAIPGQTSATLESCVERYVPGGDLLNNCSEINENLRVVCTPHDGTAAGTAIPSSDVTIANSPPTITQCSVSPGSPDTTQTLTVTGVATDVDSYDLQSMTITYEWLKNSVAIPGQVATTLAADQSVHFDVIQARCTPRDRRGVFGSPVTSAPVTILNTAPGAPVVDLTPNLPRSDQDLAVAITTPAPDIDGDTITYDYFWDRASSPFNNPTYPTAQTTVSKTATTRDEEWKVTAVAFDGYVSGGSDDDSVLIRNTPPVFVSANASPAAPITTTNMQAFGTGFYDDDSDPEAYNFTWYVNGVAQPVQAPDPAILSNTLIRRGDSVYVSLQAKDAFSTGNTVSTSSTPITVVNALPSAPVIAITPAVPGQDDALTCNIVTPSVDVDTPDFGDVVTYSYAWYKDGVLQGGETTNTINASLTEFGQNWYCTVTPNDGIGNGDIGTSPSKVIQDLNDPATPSLDGVPRYTNATSYTVTGDCTPGALECNTVRITCQNGLSTDIYNTTCSVGGDFSQLVDLDRGTTTTCSAICIDNSANDSLPSNSVTSQSCDPYDSYEDAGTYGDAGTDPVDEWATLADNNSANVTITANIIEGDAVDWYVIRTSDNAVADAAAGLNGYKFEVESLAGSSDYNFWVYKNNAAGTPFCSGTGPYDGFTEDNADTLGQPANGLDLGHAPPVNPNSCSASGGPSWALYNECTSYAGDYYIRVLREFNNTCQHYQLRAYNGRP